MAFYPYKDRGSPEGVMVYAYRNLHSSLWSLRAIEGPFRGKVISHASSVLLWDVQARVGQAGRERVLREKRKNVHAGLVGLVTTLPLHMLADAPNNIIRYNPYEGDRFTIGGEPFDTVSYALLLSSGRVQGYGRVDSPHSIWEA